MCCYCICAKCNVFVYYACYCSAVYIKFYNSFGSLLTVRYYFSHSLLCLLPSNSFHLLVEMLESYFLCHAGIFYLSVCTCHWLCSSMDYYWSLYLCHSHHAVWMTQGSPYETCIPLTDSHGIEHVFPLLFFTIARVSNVCQLLQSDSAEYRG